MQVSILRDGRAQTIDARVQTLPGDADTDRATVIQAGALSGAQVLELNPALADSLGGDPFATGVVIGRVERGSYANRIGLQGGDIVLAVNGRQVSSAAQLSNIGRGTQLSINRRGRVIEGQVR